MSRDDHDWADALAGRAPPDAASAALAEGRMLRDAARRWPAVPPPLSLPDEQTLLARARADGLLAPRRRWCAGCAERWRRWRDSPRWLGGAGLVLASLLGLWVAVDVGRAPDDLPALRAPEGVLLRSAADPAGARERLATLLAAQQVPVRRYERLGRFGIDADLPRPPPPALQALLRDEGLAVAGDGSLRVEFEGARP